MTEHRHLSPANCARLNTFAVEVGEELRRTPAREDPSGWRFGSRGSLLVYRNGAWTDFEAGTSGSDAFDLCIAHFSRSRQEALDFAAQWLAEHPGQGRLAGAADGEDEAGDAQSDQARTAFLRALWEAAVPIGGTAAAAYLRTARGIDLDALEARDCDALRFLENVRGEEHALVAALTDDAGEVLAVLETYITAPGEKSPVAPARRLFRGPVDWRQRGLVHLGDPTARVAYLTEGLEDGLTARLAGAALVLVTAGISGLGRARLPATVKEVVLVRDGDARGSSADRSLWAGAVRVLATGCSLRITPPPPLPAKDVNDLLRAEGVEAVTGLLKAAAERPGGVDDDAVLDTLSRLDRGGYDRARTSAARLLGWRAATLDREVVERREVRTAIAAETAASSMQSNAAPHGDPQQLADVLQGIRDLILRYIYAPEWVGDVLALFCAYTPFYQQFRNAVRIRIFSGEPESGKTTALMLTLRCCPTWKRVDDVTPAAFARAFAGGGCLGINEDKAFAVDDATASLLRSGFERDARKDIVEKDASGNFSVVALNLFGPVIMAGLAVLEGALQTRCIMIEMQPVPASKKQPRVTRRTDEAAAELASRVARWANDNRETVQDLRAELDAAFEGEEESDIMPAELTGRTADKLLPLFVMAAAAGGPWPERMRAAWRQMHPAPTRDDLSTGIRLLLDCRDIFRRDPRTEDAKRWTPAELVQALIAGADKSGDTTWMEVPADSRVHVRGGKALSMTQLGRILRRYGIAKQQVRDGSSHLNGPRGYYYLPSAFQRAFDTYLTEARTGVAPDEDRQAEHPETGPRANGADPEEAPASSPEPPPANAKPRQVRTRRPPNGTPGDPGAERI